MIKLTMAVMEIIQLRCMFLKAFKDMGKFTRHYMFTRLKKLYYVLCHVFVQICM